MANLSNQNGVTDLSERFRALTIQVEPMEENLEFMNMSYEELGQMRISFGEAMVNQTF